MLWVQRRRCRSQVAGRRAEVPAEAVSDAPSLIGADAVKRGQRPVIILPTITIITTTIITTTYTSPYNYR